MGECGTIRHRIRNMVIFEGRNRNIFIDIWLKDAEIEEGIGRLVYMLGKNQLGCPYPRCACGRMKEFERGEEVARSLRNGRAIGRSIMDIDEIRRESDRESTMCKIDVRIENGRIGQYLNKMMRNGSIHKERVMPYARLA